MKHEVLLERVAGIEPAPTAWKAVILPLNYTRGYVPLFGWHLAEGGAPLVCLRIRGGWSCWRDSNPRPDDYKSTALPAELQQRMP